MYYYGLLRGINFLTELSNYIVTMKSTAVSVFVISILLQASVGEEFCDEGFEYIYNQCSNNLRFSKDQVSITAVECGNTTANVQWMLRNGDLNGKLQYVTIDYNCYDENGNKLSNNHTLTVSATGNFNSSRDFSVSGVRCVFGGCVKTDYPDYCWFTFTDNAICEDECSTNNGGCNHTCTDTNESYICSCHTGYILADDDHGCNDVNECVNNTSDCEQLCHNTIGSYYCTCNEGYYLGSDNHSCLDINECNNGTSGCEQECINTNGSYYCTCWEGYDLDEDNHSCLDVDECNNGTSGCEQECINTIGSYNCTCWEGYELDEDNHSCLDIDECEKRTSGCKQECFNTIGSYYCNCSEGYDLDEDNHNCLDINECDTDNGGCSHNCSNVDGGYYCECFTGYDVDDVDDHECEDIDECDLGICEQQCNNTNGSYYCTCREGYYLGNDNRSCFDQVIIVLITVLPLCVILVCGISGTGLLASILKRKKRSYKENELFHLYELEPNSYFQEGSLLKINSFDEISATESIITIIHPLELTSATHFMIDRNPREDKDDTIKRKSSSDAISQMSEVSKTSDTMEEDSIEVEGLDDRSDNTFEDSTATNRTVYNSCSTKESTQFTNNFPLVYSEYIQDRTIRSQFPVLSDEFVETESFHFPLVYREYIQDRTIQSQFPVLSDEFMETESFHDSTDTIHLQTPVDSSVAIGPSPQHSSSTDEHISCNDRESKEKFQHASYNLTTVDVNSDYIDRFTQWKLPLNSTTSSSGYSTDDSGYLQSSSVTNYSDTGEVTQPRNSMYMLGKDFHHSSNITLDLNDDFYTETNEMEFEISCSDGYIRNN